jgi:hypothetical protein
VQDAVAEDVVKGLDDAGGPVDFDQLGLAIRAEAEVDRPVA